MRRSLAHDHHHPDPLSDHPPGRFRHGRDDPAPGVPRLGARRDRPSEGACLEAAPSRTRPLRSPPQAWPRPPCSPPRSSSPRRRPVPSAAAILDRAALALAAPPLLRRPPYQWFYHARPVPRPVTGQAGHPPRSPGPGSTAPSADRRPDGRPRAGPRVLAPRHPAAVVRRARRLPDSPRTCSPTSARTRCTPPARPPRPTVTSTRSPRPHRRDVRAARRPGPPVPRPGHHPRRRRRREGRSRPRGPPGPVDHLHRRHLAGPGRRPLGAAARPGDVRRPGPAGTAGSDIDLGEGTIITQGHVWYEMAILDHRIVDRAGARGGGVGEEDGGCGRGEGGKN